MYIYRTYIQGDDDEGMHTAIYSDKDKAVSYFKSARKKYPEAYVLTETIQWETGKVISRKEFGKGATPEEVKQSRGEYISLYRYDVEWKERTLVAEYISPEEASVEMLSALNIDGYGTKWIYLVDSASLT